MNKRVVFVVGCVVVLLAGCGVQGAIGSSQVRDAQGSVQELNVAKIAPASHSVVSARSFSGDDAYDPASVNQPAETAHDSGMVLPNTGASGAFQMAGSYSGDDAYDPAIANQPAETVRDAGKIVPNTGGPAAHWLKSSYSGDDPYDPAAGGLSR